MRRIGNQTKLAQRHFSIGKEKWPREMIWAQALNKKIAAEVNASLGILEKIIAVSIQLSAEEVMNGMHDEEFPLSIWQSGSGTQFNMNMNEVIAHRASELSGVNVHPNDHVNMSQSTNDTIPTAIHVAARYSITRSLRPAFVSLEKALEKKAKEFRSVIKVGRTHLQDAVPLTLGNEFSGYQEQVRYVRTLLERASDDIRALPIGGTAIGTQINAPRGYKEKFINRLNTATKLRFRSSRNLYAAMGAHDAIVATSGALRSAAIALSKVVNDIRWLSSGPRTGLGELILPENEPGSSIMPGKVNPTQPEMILMVCAQVIGNDAAIVSGALTLSNFEMQASKPLFAHALLESIGLLAESILSFERHCLKGIAADSKRLKSNAERSLMLVTALNRHIGYDKAAQIAKKAHKDGTTLEEAAIQLGFLTRDEFRRLVDIRAMLGPK